MAADLVAAGTEPDKISSMLYEGYPASVVKLRGLILSTLELHLNGSLAMISFPREFLTRAGAQPGDAEGVIDDPRKIDGVEVAVLMRELPDNNVKVSMRSQGRVNVERIARDHGGGGHHNAAGFVLTMGLEETRSHVLQIFQRMMEDEDKRTAARQ